MKLTLFLLLLTSTLLTSCQPNASPSDFKKLEWLLGTWKGEANGQPFYENWEKVSETTFGNINFTLCNGDTIAGGRSKIEIRNGKIAYTSDDMIWNIKELNDSVAVFENEQRNEKFTFSKTQTGEWRANLNYPRSQVEYLLKKTVSVAELLKNKPIPLIGYYEGSIEFMGKQLQTALHFEYKNGKQTATATTSTSLQLNMPFNEVCYDPPYLKLMIRDGTQNLQLNARVEENKITGKMTGEIPANISFQKTSLPNASRNYSIVPLEIKNGNITLPANLFLPNSVQPTGAVIMVSGSGPHIKEEYNGWADMLASKGVAVLTYDKRNVSPKANMNIRQASSDIVLPGELESDVIAAISILKSRKEINPQKIGLFGFSQGAVIVPVVAATNKDVAFIVAVSGNTTTDKEFIINQSLNRLRQRNFNKDDIEEAREIMEELFQYTKDKKNGEKIQRKIDKAYEKGYGQYSLTRQLPNDDEIKYLSTWNSFEHDPSQYWKDLAIPSYVVYGENDVYIPVKESVQILNGLYRDRPGLLTLRVYPNADHFIKRVPDRNNFDFPKYVEGYIGDLTAWIIKHAK